MRIAFVAPFGLQPKGTVSFRMLPLALSLASRGHSVHVVVPPWDDPSAVPGTIHERVGEGLAGAGSLTVTTLALPRGGSPAVGLTGRLVRAALSGEGRAVSTGKRTGPDVVHVFKPIGYSGLSGLALRGLRVPWVLDTDDWEGPGGWADVNPYSPAQKLSVALMEALLPRLALSVTAASRTLEARTWDMGLPRKRVFYLPNGVSRDKYDAWGRAAQSRSTANLANGPVLLLYSRLAEFPWQWALQALAGVRKHHPKARLLVVGGGFFGEERALQTEAVRIGLGDAVTVTGRVPEADLPALLAQGTVALYPMLDTLLNRAKSPAKLLEVMLMALPIVAHRVGQTSEFLGDAGVLVEAGNVEAMSRAVSALLDNPERRQKLGDMARLRVLSEFNWNRLSAVAERAYGR